MKSIVILLMLLFIINVANAELVTLPKERTTLGEMWEYICVTYISNGRYHNDSGLWACTSDASDHGKR